MLYICIMCSNKKFPLNNVSATIMRLPNATMQREPPKAMIYVWRLVSNLAEP